MNARGLTLIELLITISILATLIAIGVPSFQGLVDSSRARAATEELIQAIHLTRTKAITTNRRATLRKLDHWQSGWEVFYDEDFDGVRDPDEPQIATAGALSGVTITANTPLTHYVSFIGTGESRYAGTASGGGLQMGTFTICPAGGGEGYQLVLASSGRIRLNQIAGC